MRPSLGARLRRSGPPRPPEPSSVGGSEARIPELDSLRALAALAILVFHANESWLPFGWAAVDLFFVLSGYLITSIIIRSGEAPGFLGNFYVRRGLRTWPIYYLVLAALIALSPVLPRRFDWAGLPYALTYTQGLPRLWSGAGGRFSVYLGHTWTLAVEEQFYLIWPALALMAGRRHLSLLALACAAGSFLSRSRGILLESLFSRADGLALGGWLAAYRLGRDRSPGVPTSLRITTGPALGATLVLAILAARGGLGPSGGVRTHPGLIVLAFNLIWLAVIDLVLTHAGRPSLRLLRLRPLRRLGEISYGIYLYHLPMLLIGVEAARGLGWRGKLYEVRILALIVSVAMARLSWRYFEQPLLSLKRRFPYAEGTYSGRPEAAAPSARFREWAVTSTGSSAGAGLSRGDRIEAASREGRTR